MTTPGNGSYNWGGTTAVNATAPQPKRKAGLPGLVKILLAIVAVVIVALASVWFLQKQRPAQNGPLGWDDATLASKLDAGKLQDCDLGDDFYESVGLRDIVFKQGACEGKAKDADGNEFPVRIHTEGGPNGDVAAAGDEALVGWKQSADPAGHIPATLHDVTSSGDGMRCQMAGNKPILGNFWLAADGPCEALYPVARQITNLQTQYDWSRTDHSLFDFSSPDYLEVNPATPKVETDLYKQAKEAALPLGETFEVDDSDYNGSTFTINGGDVDYAKNSKVCVDGTFTLGQKADRYTYGFNMPRTPIALFPNGQRVPLYDEDHRSYTLKEGESQDLRLCGNDFDADMESNSFAVLVEDDRDQYVWVIENAGSENA